MDGWSAIIRDTYVNNTRHCEWSIGDCPVYLFASVESKVTLDFSNLHKMDYGMTVAVLDSGCSRNPDLVNQFWRNTKTAGCNSETFVGNGRNKLDSHGIQDDCVGYVSSRAFHLLTLPHRTSATISLIPLRKLKEKFMDLPLLA